MFKNFSYVKITSEINTIFLFQGTMLFCICVLLVITNFETLKVPPHVSDIFRMTINLNLYFLLIHADGFQSFWMPYSYDFS